MGFSTILADLRVNPGRHVLTAISLFFGVVAVVSIVVIGAIANSVLIATAEQQGGRKATYVCNISRAVVGSTQLASLINALPSNPDVVAALSMSGDQLSVGLSPKPGQPFAPSRVELVLVAGDWSGPYRAPVIDGDWLGEDEQTLPPTLVMNQAAADILGGSQARVSLSGSTTDQLTGTSITDVVNDGSSDPRGYLKLASYLSFFPHFTPLTDIQLILHGPELSAQQATSLAEDLLFDAGIHGAVSVTRTDTVDGFVSVVAAIQVGFGFAAALALVVAALGIVNVGLASIQQRARELVIRRAIGATRSSVFVQVVGSSVLLSLIVAAVSIGATFVLVQFLPAFFPPDSAIDFPAYPWTAAAAGTTAAVVTAIVGSITPGIAASRLEPAMALRG